MLKYQIISTIDGSVKSADLQQLSRDLHAGILCQVEDDGTLTQLGPITIWDLVLFARTWAGWANPETIPEALHALELVDRWLEDGKSVTVDELDRAGAAARAAGASVRASVRAAARAVEAAANAAAYAAARAADADAEAEADAEAAAWAAAGAAWTAAAWAARDAMFVRQHQFILETLAGR